MSRDDILFDQYRVATTSEDDVFRYFEASDTRNEERPVLLVQLKERWRVHEDAFSRYLPSIPPDETGTSEQRNDPGELGEIATGTNISNVPVVKRENPNENGRCSGVPVQLEGPEVEGLDIPAPSLRSD